MSNGPCNYVVNGDIATCTRCDNVWRRGGPEPHCERARQYVKNARRKVLRIMYGLIFTGLWWLAVLSVVELTGSA